MATLTNARESLRLWWEGATPATRALAVGMILVIIIGLAVAASMAASPDFKPIYHNVSGKDASAIENTLREKNITMRYADGDNTVSVPSKDEGEAVMAIEAAGILSKDSDIVGIEGLDKIGMGTSTEVERQRILASDEGELDRKLMRLDPVSNAAITISTGNSSELFGNDVAPSASVILTLKAGETLNSEQVKGVVFLVAHAVTGLTPANITLTDQSGTPLWKDNGAGENIYGGGQPLDENAKFADRERIKLQDLLESTLGPHKAIVTVNAELNFDQTQTHSTEYTPAAGMRTGLPVSVQTKDESYQGPGASGVGGAAGSSSNLGPSTYPSSGVGGSGNYKNEDGTTNYENNRTEKSVIQAPGSINKLSVAALIDTSVPADIVPKIQSILTTAIGAGPGDTARLVTVQQLPFDNSAQKALAAQAAATASQQLWGSVARAAAVSVVACLLLFMLMRAGRGSRRAFVEPQLALAGDGANIGLLENASDNELENILEERPLRIEDVLSEMPEAAPRRAGRRRMQAPSIQENQDLKMESIQEMIDNHPESVALLLKGWMAEESRVAA
ncbi:MAG: flagellar M-ring protein FliF [Armatimonadota bacterium]|nr:flagellar M-ring protein FliF [Armatimonadota bacterium]